ncbi:MAG: phosphoglycerate kinase, partial [Candidatus Bipolaricaulia bacterium]
DIILLENVRFYPQEEANDENFSRELAHLADCYVNDAFGTAHRAHASTYGVAKFLPAAAGLLLEREITMLNRVRENPHRPFLAIVGGAKLKDKIGVLQDFLGKVDAFLIGGGVAFTLLRAQGACVGSSLVDEKLLEEAKGVLEKAREHQTGIVLPADVQAVRESEAGVERAVFPAHEIPDGWQGWDIGPQTIKIFQERIARAKTIVWAGPLGRFEQPPFDRGTREVAQAIAHSSAFAIIGGGDTAAALQRGGLAGAQNIYFSTGGGATLEFLGGRKLPPIEILKK